MDFKELQYVLSIAKHHNITKAAAGLYISQPSLSKYLQNLEASLGLKLFCKKGNYFELTYAGERYLIYANKIMQISNQMNAELETIRMQDQGRIRIALPLIRSACLLPDLIVKFHQYYPDIEVELLERPEEQLEEMIVNQEADLAIFHQRQITKQLTYELLRKEELVIAVEKNHLLLQKAARKQGCRYPWIDLHEVCEVPMIGYDKTLRIHHLTETILASNGITPKVRIRTASIEGAVRMASQGLGICFVNEADVNVDALNLEISYLSFGTPNTMDQLVLGYSKDTVQTEYAKKWIHLIRDAYLNNQ